MPTFMLVYAKKNCLLKLKIKFSLISLHLKNKKKYKNNNSIKKARSPALANRNHKVHQLKSPRPIASWKIPFKKLCGKSIKKNT
jgi:hypothetical protein